MQFYDNQGKKKQTIKSKHRMCFPFLIYKIHNIHVQKYYFNIQIHLKKLPLKEILKRFTEDDDLTETGSSFHNLGKDTKTELKKAFVREVL